MKLLYHKELTLNQHIYFSPVNLSLSVSFSDPARDPKRAEESFSSSTSLLSQLNTTSTPPSFKKNLSSLNMYSLTSRLFSAWNSLTHIFIWLPFIHHSLRSQLKHILWGICLFPCNVFLSWNLLYFIITTFCFNWLFLSLTVTTWERDRVCLAYCGLSRAQNSVWW